MCIYRYIKTVLHASSFAYIADFRYLFEDVNKFFVIDKQFRGLLYILSYFKTICAAKENIVPMEQTFSQVRFLQIGYGSFLRSNKLRI